MLSTSRRPFCLCINELSETITISFEFVKLVVMANNFKCAAWCFNCVICGAWQWYNKALKWVLSKYFNILVQPFFSVTVTIMWTDYMKQTIAVNQLEIVWWFDTTIFVNNNCNNVKNHIMHTLAARHPEIVLWRIYISVSWVVHRV